MPSKPRTLAGIICSRRHADAEYNRARRDPDVARIHGSARWQAVRAQVLRAEPLCRACVRAGRTELATQVDHVVPLDVAPERAFDPTNLQPLCTVCHGQKSASERQGVGGPVSSQASAATSGRVGVSLFSRDEARNRTAPRVPPGGPQAAPGAPGRAPAATPAAGAMLPGGRTGANGGEAR